MADAGPDRRFLMERFKPWLAALADGRTLTRLESEQAFEQVLRGDASPAQIGAFLMALRLRGESVAEITGAVAAMRSQMLRVAAPPGAIDIVGTGGDNHGTFNISTLAALIVAACGVPVAKHGNRAASSRSGSSDVLTALGVSVGLDGSGVERCLREVGVGFMSAPVHHGAMRRVSELRAELGTRTIFNLLGPLANPAGVTRLLVGVYDAKWLDPLAGVLAELGAERAWAVHGNDGLDEVTTTAETRVVAWENGAMRRFTITPEMFGLHRASLADLKGGDAATNAAALRRVLDGDRNAYREIACLNAAAALVVAGAAIDLHVGLRRAREAIDTGEARKRLDALVRVSHGASVGRQQQPDDPFS